MTIVYFFILFNTNLNTTMPVSNSFSWFSNVNQPYSSPDFISLASSFISCSVACLFLKPCILGIAYLLCSFRFNVRHRIQLFSTIIIKTLFNFPNHSHCICDIKYHLLQYLYHIQDYLLFFLHLRMQNSV